LSAAATAELFEGAPPTAGAHIDVDLGSGLNARVPLALSDAEASTDAGRSKAIDALVAAIAKDYNPGAEFDINLRLADVVVAWNVFRHFYPYWTEAGVDWNTRLPPQLDDAWRATTREGQRNALRRLVADARDGHGGVGDTRQAERRALIPIQLSVVENRIVITASDVPADAPVGAVVSTIDGVPARTADHMRPPPSRLVRVPCRSFARRK
jgi:hypothetical protein